MHNLSLMSVILAIAAWASPMKRKRDDYYNLNLLIDAATLVEHQKNTEINETPKKNRNNPARDEFAFPKLPPITTTPKGLKNSLLTDQEPSSTTLDIIPFVRNLINAYDVSADAPSRFNVAHPVYVHQRYGIDYEVTKSPFDLKQFMVSTLGHRYSTDDVILQHLEQYFKFVLYLNSDFNRIFEVNLAHLPLDLRSKLFVAQRVGVRPLPPDTPSHRIPLVLELYIFQCLCALSYQQKNDWFIEFSSDLLLTMKQTAKFFNSTLSDQDVEDYLEIILKVPVSEAKTLRYYKNDLYEGKPMFCMGQPTAFPRIILMSKGKTQYFRKVAEFLKVHRGVKGLVPVLSYSQ